MIKRKLGGPLLSLLFNNLLEFLESTIRQEKTMCGIQIGMEEKILFIQHDYLHKKILKNLQNVLVEPTNTFRKFSG